MFDFLFKDKDGNLQSIIDVIMLNAERLCCYEAAREKAVNMIAEAIAKSEIILTGADGKRITDINYYRLNIRPNDNESGTDFWMKAIHKLLTEFECLICRIGDKYYVVDSYTENDTILKGRRYTNITISYKGNQINLKKTITADDMIVLNWRKTKQMALYDKYLKLVDETVSNINEALRILSAPKYKLKMQSQMNFRQKNEDGTDRVVTRDEFVEKLKTSIKEKGVGIIPISEGINLEWFKTESSYKSEDFSKLRKEIESEVAMAYDIPEAVYFGNITEKSDATNEFITYAVSPVGEVINDSLNSKLVGEEDYIKGERIRVWLSRFKHIDVIDSAPQLEKLRGIGFTLDEIFEMVGYPTINNEFSKKRLFTKNFAEEGESNE